MDHRTARQKALTTIMQPLPNATIESFARHIVCLRETMEFHTFWLGTTIPGPIDPDEAIAFRRKTNQRVGLRVLELAPELVATPQWPDARFIMVIADGTVTVRV